MSFSQSAKVVSTTRNSGTEMKRIRIVSIARDRLYTEPYIFFLHLDDGRMFTFSQQAKLLEFLTEHGLSKLKADNVQYRLRFYGVVNARFLRGYSIQV